MKDFDKFTSEKLLTAVKAGDCASFNEIYHRHRQKVYGYAHHFARSREEAEELTQDVFVRLWENRSKIDPSKNFEAFLYTLIRNNFLEALRKKARARNFRKEQLENEPAYNSTDNYIDFKECEQIANEAIETLSPQVKIVYLLSRKDGRSHEDISLHMGISKNTVNNHIKKSLGTIRKFFREYSPETVLSLLMMIFY